MRGRPMSSEKITVVPVGPMTHLTVIGPSDPSWQPLPEPGKIYS